MQMSLETLSNIITTCLRKLISKNYLLDDTEIVREMRILTAVHSLSGKDAGDIGLETENCYVGAKTDSRYQTRKL